MTVFQAGQRIRLCNLASGMVKNFYQEKYPLTGTRRCAIMYTAYRRCVPHTAGMLTPKSQKKGGLIKMLIITTTIRNAEVAKS